MSKALEIVHNVCPYCNEELIMNKRSFANHVRWCKKNPKYEEQLASYSNNHKSSMTSYNNERFGEKKEFVVKCATCGNEFTVIEREKTFPKKEKYFCSISCRNKREHSEETKAKIGKSVIKWIEENGRCGGVHYKTIRATQTEFVCCRCGNLFYENNKNYTRKYCSKECADAAVREMRAKKITDAYTSYRKQAQFKFSIAQYPFMFDSSLIKEYGWYSATNHGGNVNGLNRDHRYSIYDGFNNKVDPYYLSHPVNCELMPHGDNIRKYIKSSITKEELISMVNEWNNTNGEYPNKIDYHNLEDCKQYNMPL